MSNITIYTDGAYSAKRKQGGSAFVILKDNKIITEYSKCIKGGTNNIAELYAMIMALNCIKDKVDIIDIYSDSMYVIGSGWKGWKRNKNLKIWEVFDKELSRVNALCPNVNVIHVDGHQKDEKWNNYVDKLAVSASHE